MFNIGISEFILIAIVALLVVGPSKLPELARTLGKAFGEFRRMADDMKESWQNEVTRDETEKEEPSNTSTEASLLKEQDQKPSHDASVDKPKEGVHEEVRENHEEPHPRG